MKYLIEEYKKNLYEDLFKIIYSIHPDSKVKFLRAIYARDIGFFYYKNFGIICLCSCDHLLKYMIRIYDNIQKYLKFENNMGPFFVYYGGYKFCFAYNCLQHIQYISFEEVNTLRKKYPEYISENITEALLIPMNGLTISRENEMGDYIKYEEFN